MPEERQLWRRHPHRWGEPHLPPLQQQRHGDRAQVLDVVGPGHARAEPRFLRELHPRRPSSAQPHAHPRLLQPERPEQVRALLDVPQQLFALLHPLA